MDDLLSTEREQINVDLIYNSNSNFMSKYSSFPINSE